MGFLAWPPIAFSGFRRYRRHGVLGVMARPYTWNVFADAIDKEFNGALESRAYSAWALASLRQHFRDAFEGALAGIVSPAALAVIVKKTKEAAEKVARGMAFPSPIIAFLFAHGLTSCIH